MMLFVCCGALFRPVGRVGGLGRGITGYAGIESFGGCVIGEILGFLLLVAYDANESVGAGIEDGGVDG